MAIEGRAASCSSRLGLRRLNVTLCTAPAHTPTLLVRPLQFHCLKKSWPRCQIEEISATCIFHVSCCACECSQHALIMHSTPLPSCFGDCPALSESQQVCRRKDRRFYFHLFNDIMMYSEKTSVGLRLHRAIPVRSPVSWVPFLDLLPSIGLGSS